MGGYHSFFIESKLFQLVIEEGGRYFSLQIFKHGKYSMRSVFMGNDVGQWLMKNIEHIVLGVNSKQFFTFRDGDIAYTLQRSANSFGQFLLLTELKAGSSRRSVTIPEGGAKNGWRMFGIELREMMYPSQYAVGGSSQLKLVAPPHRQNSEIQNSRTFAEMVQGYHVKVEDRKRPTQLCVTDKGKTQIGEEKMVVPDPEHAKKVVSGRPVVNSCPLAAGGGAVKPRSINGDINLGEKIPAGNKLRFPLQFNSNSKEAVYGIGSDLRNACWTGKGLTMVIDEKGKRRVSWDYNRGGPKCFKWAPRETSKNKPTVGLSLKPKLAQPCLGSTQLTVASFSSPSSHEMGEPSAKASLTPLAHSVITAEALSDKPKSPMLTEVVADRQASDGCSA